MLLKLLVVLSPLLFKLVLSVLDYATCSGVRIGPVKVCIEEDDLETAYSMLFTIVLPRRFLKLRPEHLRIILLHELLHVKYGHYVWPELMVAALLLPLLWLPAWILNTLMVMLLSVLEPVLLEIAELHVRKLSLKYLQLTPR